MSYTWEDIVRFITDSKIGKEYRLRVDHPPLTEKEIQFLLGKIPAPGPLNSQFCNLLGIWNLINRNFIKAERYLNQSDPENFDHLYNRAVAEQVTYGSFNKDLLIKIADSGDSRACCLLVINSEQGGFDYEKYLQMALDRQDPEAYYLKFSEYPDSRLWFSGGLDLIWIPPKYKLFFEERSKFLFQSADLGYIPAIKLIISDSRPEEIGVEKYRAYLTTLLKDTSRFDLAVKRQALKSFLKSHFDLSLASNYYSMLDSYRRKVFRSRKAKALEAENQAIELLEYEPDDLLSSVVWVLKAESQLKYPNSYQDYLSSSEEE